MIRFSNSGHRLRLLTAVLSLGLFSPYGLGCMSQSKGEALQRDVKRLQKDLAEERASGEEARKRLTEVMERATSLSTRNSADVSVYVERLQHEMSKLTGQVETLGQNMEGLKTRVAEQEAATKRLLGTNTSQSGTGGSLPSGRDELFSAGNAQIAASKHEAGRRLLRHFIARYPKDRRAAQAQLNLGNSYYAQQKLAPAIQEFRKVIERHKASSAVPEALYKIGMSFYQLKYCSDAKSFFEDLLKRHRSSSYASKSREVLKRIRRYRKNRRICTS